MAFGTNYHPAPQLHIHCAAVTYYQQQLTLNPRQQSACGPRFTVHPQPVRHMQQAGHPLRDRDQAFRTYAPLDSVPVQRSSSEAALPEFCPCPQSYFGITAKFSLRTETC